MVSDDRSTEASAEQACAAPTVAALDAQEFRRALGAFVTGVTVVATVVDGKPRGFTANSFTSVSLDPPLILACIGKSSSNFASFAHTERFSVNILSDQQRDVAQNFAARIEDRFANVGWHIGPNGSPIVDSSASWFDCDLFQRIDAGDHFILIGRVRSFGSANLSPLGYCRGNYVLFQLEQEIVASQATRTKVGAILETPEGIIVIRDRDRKTLRLPCATKIGSREDNDGLYGTLDQLASGFDLDFLYSVYDDASSDVLNVYYRGQANGLIAGASGEVIPVNDIPYELLEDDALRTLLSRYVEERADFRYSVYSGNAERGRYWSLEQVR